MKLQDKIQRRFTCVFVQVFCLNLFHPVQITDRKGDENYLRNLQDTSEDVIASKSESFCWKPSFCFLSSN